MTLALGDSSSISTDVVSHIERTEKESKLILSYEVLIICYWIIYTVLCQTISIFGIFTNIINIVCFVKQGFKESVNVSLLGKAHTSQFKILWLAGGF